jgi:thiamine pyrophosphokinase
LKRCAIIGAAPIEQYRQAETYLKEADFVIYCDGGLKHWGKDRLDRKPDLIVGDFDSWPDFVPCDLAEVIHLPCEKDDTDTVYAMKEALGRGFLDFVFLGVLGGRLDHTLGNVYMLEYLAQAGGKGVLVDDFSECTLISPGETAYVREDCRYFSLISISGPAEGIQIQGAKYALEDGRIESRYQYGVSNQVLPGETAQIYVRSGSLLLIKVLRE